MKIRKLTLLPYHFQTYSSFVTWLSAVLFRWFVSESHITCSWRVSLFFWATFNFFSFIFISWRLITLQYCSGFCHTLTWISHVYTCIPHPDPLSHLPLYPIPLGLPSAPGPSTCLMHPTWAGDLFTLDNTHVSMLFSQNISPSPPPTESKSVFCTSVSLFLFCI